MAESNQLPFNWVQFPTEQEQDIVPDSEDHEVKPDHVVTSIKNIIHTIVNSTSAPVPCTTTEMLETTQVEFTTPTTSTVGTTFEVKETIDSSIVREIFQNNNTVMAGNDTIITEMNNSNNTVITAIDDVMNNTSSDTDTLATIVDTVVTTTETVVTKVTDAVTSIMPSSTVSLTAEENTYSLKEHGDYSEDNSLYIVLGVILGALIVIMIILIVIYRRYKSNFNQRSAVYCVTDLNEVRISDTDQKEIHNA